MIAKISPVIFINPLKVSNTIRGLFDKANTAFVPYRKMQSNLRASGWHRTGAQILQWGMGVLEIHGDYILGISTPHEKFGLFDDRTRATL